jgi:hypothetical protein
MVLLRVLRRSHGSACHSWPDHATALRAPDRCSDPLDPSGTFVTGLRDRVSPRWFGLDTFRTLGPTQPTRRPNPITCAAANGSLDGESSAATRTLERLRGISGANRRRNEKTLRFAGLLQAADGTRTHDLLHGKQWRRSRFSAVIRGCGYPQWRRISCDCFEFGHYLDTRVDGCPPGSIIRRSSRPAAPRARAGPHGHAVDQRRVSSQPGPRNCRL